MSGVDRRWAICLDDVVLGVYLRSELPDLPDGSYALELSDVDDGVSLWYFHEVYGLVMEGAEPHVLADGEWITSDDLLATE